MRDARACGSVNRTSAGARVYARICVRAGGGSTGEDVRAGASA